jgi:hypothetical protein
LSDILLSHEVSINLFVESLVFLLLIVALFHTIIILKNYQKNSTTEYQYKLEKRSYLVITIISFALIVKIMLLVFFTYTLNELSNIIPGAMCAAGVIKANTYGEKVLILKIIIIMLTLLWITLNQQDQISKNYPFFKQKMYFFVAIFILITVELSLEILFLTNISTQTPVLCCSTIYKAVDDTSSLPFNLSTLQLITLFYLLYILLMIFAYLRKRVMLFTFCLFYIYIAYYAVVYFFSTYVYELPTHKCPFCMLQSDYYYIGYLIFIFFFIATFYTLSATIYKFANKNFNKAIIWHTLFIIICSFPFIFYILKNGVVL